MNRKGYFGQKGEEKTCEYLKMHGFSIVERNFRCRTGEIDIVARKRESIHFVEVKTRSSTDYGFPAESVTREKQRKILLACKYYLACHRELSNLRVQMDVAEVLMRDDKYYIRYVENAFGEGDD